MGSCNANTCGLGQLHAASSHEEAASASEAGVLGSWLQLPLLCINALHLPEHCGRQQVSCSSEACCAIRGSKTLSLGVLLAGLGYLIKSTHGCRRSIDHCNGVDLDRSCHAGCMLTLISPYSHLQVLRGGPARCCRLSSAERGAHSTILAPNSARRGARKFCVAAMRPQRVEPGPGQESCWDYPRPPKLERSDAHLVGMLNGKVIKHCYDMAPP